MWIKQMNRNILFGLHMERDRYIQKMKQCYIEYVPDRKLIMLEVKKKE